MTTEKTKTTISISKEEMFKINEILIRRKNKFWSPLIDEGSRTDAGTRLNQVMSINADISTLGYCLSEDMINSLKELDILDCCDVYSVLSSTLDTITGNNVIYKPMYPNFPRQVMEMSDAELYFNAIVHYLTYGEWMPEYETEKRLPLPINNDKLKVITVGNLEDFEEIVTNLIFSPTSLSEMDKKDIETYVNLSYHNLKTITNIVYKTNKEIPFRETKAFIQKLILEEDSMISMGIIRNMNNTITDCLRLAIELSDGDTSMSELTKFKKFTRKERRILLDMMNTVLCKRAETRLSPEKSMSIDELVQYIMDKGYVDAILEEAYMNRMQFIRLGEIIHPSTPKYAKKYPLVNAMYNVLRNDKVKTYYGKVDEAITNKDLDKTIKLLVTKPGEFARRLDLLLRTDGFDNTVILKEFSKVADKVSTNVLYQVLTHFSEIAGGKDYYNKPRIFFPKGRVQNIYVTDSNSLKGKVISNAVAIRVIAICNNAINRIYAQRDYMGAVYVDKKLFSKMIMPFSQRSASATSKMLTRGSRIKLDDSTNVIRSFIHWTNTKTKRIDLDLSVGFYNDQFSLVERVAFTNLKTSYACHSGDITNGGDINGPGVAEFVDININDTIAHYKKIDDSIRYAVFQVLVFSPCNITFKDLPNASFGYMQREDVDSGEIFEPSTVETKFKIDLESSVSVPVAFDLVEREIIWTDLALRMPSQCYNSYNTIENNIRGGSLSLYAIANVNKTSMYDVIIRNINSRGFLVEDIDSADVIFADTIDDKDEDKTYITPYDLDIIANLL